MEVLVTTVGAVRDHGDTLTIVTVGEHEVVANKKEDGTPRWTAGELVVYVPEGAIIPDDVLKERGYWDEVKGKGLLEGKRGNRVKMRRFAGFESRGLLFKVLPSVDAIPENHIQRGCDYQGVNLGDNVMEFLGITEHTV
ncbi:MAG: hypothetical protein M0R77_18440 [Gammaproteobacteria bacterium]|nr:hypothetical protein [Gammaproteobacteria bacterium]